MYDVVSIGSATLDVFLQCPEVDLSSDQQKKHLMLPFGEKIEVKNVLFETGGGATNSATTFSRFGLKTAIIAKIGKDFPASIILKHIKKEHINTSFLVVDNLHTTDFSSIIWAQDRGNVLLVNRGKGRLETSDVSWNRISTKWFYISSIEGNFDMLQKIKSIKLSHPKLSIAWNPGKRELAQKKNVFSFLPYTELFILNCSEINKLLSTNKSLTPSFLKTIEKTITSSKIIITDGHNGSYYWNGKNWKHAQAFPIKRKETTGAGDAFGSGFVAALINGYSENDALKFASANAASVVLSLGAKRGILTKEKSKKWMNKNLSIQIL